MPTTLRHPQLRGSIVVDRNGSEIGRVRDTHPQDGSGLPELVLVDVGSHLPRRRWLPVDGATLVERELCVPFARWEVEDAPCAEDLAWGRPTDVARAYWFTVDE